jgi:hydroxyacylglutathione hydrolase
MNGSVTTIDLGFVNAYLVEAEGGWVLVDTGIAGHWQKLQAGLRAAGCEKGRLRLVVITHADMDHAGNAARVHDAFAAPLAAHAVDGEAMRTGRSAARTGRTPGAAAAMRVIRVLSRIGRGIGLASPEVTLRDGDRLDSWGLAARVVHLPGHTGGSIGILTDQHDLICGDACVNRGSPSPSPYVENMEDYRASVGKLRALASTVRRVYPGHGDAFDGSKLAGLAL